MKSTYRNVTFYAFSTQYSRFRAYRYAAYRQFTWWMHGWLGKRVRRVIPSCAINCIRNNFPELNQIYTGYKDVDAESEIDDAWIFND